MQGHDLPAAAWITFGEAWHATHHAWPHSARFGIEPGQPDPGWWLLRAFARLGWVWDLREPSNLTRRPGVRRVGEAGIVDGSGRADAGGRGAPDALRFATAAARWSCRFRVK